ncbi:MAG: AbrB family transcriptional regulator [Solirubrobacteraceae bacterium]
MLSRWAAIVAATIAVSLAAEAVGLPSAALFAALLVGIGYALVFGDAHPLTPPKPVLTFGQVVIGVALGAQLTSDTLTTVAGDWLPITVITVATLVISLAAGLLLARATGLDRPTALLGLIAGGASGIVAMSDELGADARLVAFMQYLRVLIVVVAAALIATVLFGAGGNALAPGAGSAGLAGDLAFTAGCGVAGVLIARRLPVTAGSLLVPLVLAAVLSVSGAAGGAHVPARVQDLGFAAIGLQVGLRFTVATIRQAGHLLPAVVAAIAGMIAACGGLALLVLFVTDVSFSDAYLATTPGGLYAVLAVAIGGGGNVGFVLAVQALRLFTMILAAPPLVRLITRSSGGRA